MVLVARAEPMADGGRKGFDIPVIDVCDRRPRLIAQLPNRSNVTHHHGALTGQSLQQTPTGDEGVTEVDVTVTGLEPFDVTLLIEVSEPVHPVTNRML